MQPETQIKINSQQPMTSLTIDLDLLEPIQHEPLTISKLLCLQHIRTIGHYLMNGVKSSSLLKYNADYEKFIKTSRIRDLSIKKYQKGEQFNLFTSIIATEACSIMIVFALALVVTIASVVIVYFQKQLVKTIVNSETNGQIKFFIIIVSLILLRLLVFNYLIALANNIALNIRVSLENYYMRLIFMVDNEDLHTKINKFRFLVIEHITDGVIFFPYLFISFLITAGIIGLIFVLRPLYGAVVLVAFVIFLLILIKMLMVTYEQLGVRSEQKLQLTKQSKLIFDSLIKMIHENITRKFLQHHIKRKETNLNEDRHINLIYGSLQLFADAFIIIPIIILYGIYHNTTDGQNISDVYLAALYLSIIYFPVKLMVYGSFYIVYATVNYKSLINDTHIHNKKRMKDLNRNLYSLNHHSYAQNISDCFQYQYEVFQAQRIVSKKTLKEQQRQIENGVLPLRRRITSTPVLDNLHLSHDKNVVIMCSSIGCQNKMYDFLQRLKGELPRDQKYACIGQTCFLVPQNIKQNIRLYEPYSQQNQAKIKRILQLVDLGQFIDTVDNDHFLVSQALGKLYSWHTSRLELARALYHNVDYLIIDRFNLIQDSNLMKKVIYQRNLHEKVTILVDNTNFELLKYSTKVMLFIEKQPFIEISTYQQTKNSQNWKAIYQKIVQEQIQIRSDHQHITQQLFEIQMNEPQAYKLRNRTYSDFFSQVHPGGFLIIVVILAIPCALKFYVAYLIGQTFEESIFFKLLGFGVGYLLSILIRLFILAGYLKAASLQLFKKLIQKYDSYTYSEIMALYHNYDSGLQSSFSNIDNHFLMSFQLGITVFLEGIISVIIFSIGQALFLSVALPVVIVTTLMSVIKIRFNRRLASMRQRHSRIVKNYVHSCTVSSNELLGYHRYSEVQKHFFQLNRLSVVFSANQMWILSGVRMLGEIILTIGLIVFLIIMISIDIDPSQATMVSLGVSLFLNVNMTYRFSVQSTSYLEKQLLAITKIQYVIRGKKIEQDETVEQEQKPNPLEEVDFNRLQYKNVSIYFGDLLIENINFKIMKGERIAVSYDSKNLANIIFWALNPKIVEASHIKGQILVNQKRSYKDVNIKIFYLTNQPVTPIKGDIFNFLHILKPDLTELQLAQKMTEFFEKVGIPSVFNPYTQISNLSLPYQQILNIFRCTCIEKYDIIVNSNGLEDVNIIVHKLLQSYLVDSDTPVIISITNLESICQFYPRQFKLQDGLLDVDPSPLQLMRAHSAVARLSKQ